MKTLLTILILLLAVPSFAQQVVVVKKKAAGGCAGYLICQGFEGTGYDNSETWTEATADSGVVDEDYTTTVLDGSQSLFIQSGTVAWDVNKSVASFAATSPVYWFAMMRVPSVAYVKQVLMILDSTNAEVMKLELNGSTWKIFCGTASGTTTAISANTTYYLWGDYTKGTGADAQCNLYVSVDGTKPGSASIAVTTGSKTTNATQIKLSCETSRTDGQIVIWDKVRVSASNIGSNPQ